MKYSKQVKNYLLKQSLHCILSSPGRIKDGISSAGVKPSDETTKSIRFDPGSSDSFSVDIMSSPTPNQQQKLYFYQLKYKNISIKWKASLCF